MAGTGRKITTKIQPAGWLVAIFGGVFPFVLGYIFADGVLLVIALLSVIIFCAARFLGRVNLIKVDLELEMPTRVYAGKGFEAVLYLDNKKCYTDGFLINVDLNVLHNSSLSAKANWVEAGGASRLLRRMKIPLRGATTEMKLKLTSFFPMGLYHHEVVEMQPCPLVVYPRLIIPIEIMDSGSLNDVDPQRGLQLGDTVGELRGIRGWQAGDPSKRIHWPASARSLVRDQGLRVREFDPPGYTPKNCCVMFHSHAIHGEVYRHDRFERACSLAAGTLNYLHSRRVDTCFVADFLAWQEMACKTRSEYIELLAILAEAKRALGTDVEDLQEKLDEISGKFDQLVVISDVSPDVWSESLVFPENALVIDIRQMRFGRKFFAVAS